MKLKERETASFSAALFILKSVGYWTPTTQFEKWLNKAMILYSTISLMFIMCVQIRGVYFYWGDLAVTTYMGINILVLIMDVFKMITLSIHKKKFFKLVAYMREHFWQENYDQNESAIVDGTERICKYFVYAFTFFCESSLFFYCLRPIVGNIGRNESERELILDMCVDWPLSMTPYYEITITIQVVAQYQNFLLYVSSENMFHIMCLHVAGQFRVLQYRMSNMPMVKVIENLNGNAIAELSKQYSASLREYIEQHKALVNFCATLEEIFGIIILGQVLTFSILICVLGYQVLLADLSFTWAIVFVLFLFASMIQLLVFTYSCDCVTQESLNVAGAVYAGPWTDLSMDKCGATMRKNLQFVIMRAKQPSSLTAYGFFPISIETCTKIMSTAVSYFTLLRQNSIDTSM